MPREPIIPALPADMTPEKLGEILTRPVRDTGKIKAGMSREEIAKVLREDDEPIG